MPTDPRLGTTLAGYRILARLGRGGMSVVYLAEDPRLARRVAVKLMDAAHAEDDTYRERFLREVRAAAGLEHPSIVPIHEAGETPEGDLYLVMRHVSGGDLGALLRSEGSLDLDRALRILSGVAEALDAAHGAGLVHRDVKPSNVLVDRAGGRDHPYLADFGIAKPLGRGTSGSLTSPGQMLGTVDYMAPEQLEGRPVDARTDVYALGCVLYECLAGEPPFSRSNPVAVMDAHRHEPPPRVTDRRPDLPPGIDDVIARAMAKDREERHASCVALMRATATAAGPIDRRPRRGPNGSRKTLRQ